MRLSLYCAALYCVGDTDLVYPNSIILKFQLSKLPRHRKTRLRSTKELSFNQKPIPLTYKIERSNGSLPSELAFNLKSDPLYCYELACQQAKRNKRNSALRITLTNRN